MLRAFAESLRAQNTDSDPRCPTCDGPMLEPHEIEGLRAGLADIAAGRVRPLSEIRADLHAPTAGPELAEVLTDSLLAEIYLALNHRWVSDAYETAQIDKARTLIVQALTPWLARDAAKDAMIAALEARLSR